MLFQLIFILFLFIDNPSKVVFVIKTNLHALKTCRPHVFKWIHKMKIPTTRMKIVNFWIMNMIQNMAKVFGKFHIIIIISMYIDDNSMSVIISDVNRFIYYIDLNFVKDHVLRETQVCLFCYNQISNTSKH